MRSNEAPTILVVSAVPPTNTGGMELSTAYLCRALLLLNIHVTLLAPGTIPEEPDLLHPAVKHVLVPRRRFYHPAFVRSLRKAFDVAVAEEGPRALISESAAGYSLLPRCRNAGIPFLFHAHGTALRELKAAWIRRSPIHLAYRVVLLAMDRLLLPRVQGIAAVSQMITGELASLKWLHGIPIIRHVPNGIPIDVFSPDSDARDTVRRQFGIRRQDRVVVFVGRLTHPKGADLLLAALSRIRTEDRTVYLWILGDGEARAALQTQARTTGIGHLVTFHGRVPPSTLKRLVNAADVFCLPSRRPEGMPYALIEALALGLPSVASDALQIGSSDVIHHRSDDSHDLARALQEALSRRAPDLSVSAQTVAAYSLETQSASLKRMLREVGVI